MTLAEIEQMRASRRQKYANEITPDAERELELYRKLNIIQERLFDTESERYVDEKAEFEKWNKGLNNFRDWTVEYERLVEHLHSIGKLRKDRICKCGDVIRLPWKDECTMCRSGFEQHTHWTDGNYEYYIKKRRTGMYYGVYKRAGMGREYQIPDIIETPDLKLVTKQISVMGQKNEWKPMADMLVIEAEGVSELKLEVKAK